MRLRLLFGHEFDEIIEEVMRVVRSGRRFRVILHAEYRMAAVTKTFQGLIVQVHVRDLDIGWIERIPVDRESVIVRRNFNSLVDPVEHRVVRAAMTEFELIGLATECQAQELVAQADAENRDFPN